eukprot:1140406-Pelagomonas_calceolata.AAC.13
MSSNKLKSHKLPDSPFLQVLSFGELVNLSQTVIKFSVLIVTTQSFILLQDALYTQRFERFLVFPAVDLRGSNEMAG